MKVKVKVKTSPFLHPPGDVMDVFDAAQRYKDQQQTVIVLAGKEYGSGSSRDWAAKGPWILVRGSVIQRDASKH